MLLNNKISRALHMLLGNPPHLLPPALGGKSVLEVETIKYLGHHLDSDFVTHFLRTPTMKVDMLDFCTSSA